MDTRVHLTAAMLRHMAVNHRFQLLLARASYLTLKVSVTEHKLRVLAIHYVGNFLD